ncbi:major intrinsic protein [Stylonychia lemnae]|uniref:Major intrinsic protein n=1 Tax=Stylonychia lemnae TaxID=5949 RepID=A0A078AXP3_STYLE|nr:major intrinsic protein [Stylonychia lemnae]|eukprot:CDW87230.1 major intrinsic protein [Stylonychia lemnae]
MEQQLSTREILRNSFLKLIFEFIGSMFLTVSFNSTQKVVLSDLDADNNFSRNQTSLLLCLWVLIVFGWKVSGSHYNPAISFAFMLRRDVGKFPRPLGIAYILIQFLGGFVGALLSWFLRTDPGASGNIYIQNSSYFFYAMVAETLGSFLVVFFYLTQTEKKTVFSQEQAVNCFIIASAYIGARAMLNGTKITLSGAVLNPAIGLGTCFTQLFDTGVDHFTWVWIYALMPFVGAILAVLFHEYVFKKTQEVLLEEEEDDHDEGVNLLDK